MIRGEDFAGKKVLIGITGCIGAYKTYTVIRELVKRGAEVRVILTRSAGNFVSKVVLETFTGNRVCEEMFGAENREAAVHIELSRWSDCFLICPATANCIGKAACGIADDLLSTTIISYSGRILFAPAMNTRMYENPVVQENLRKLKSLGHEFIGPDSGDLASLKEGAGPGRLAAEEVIMDALCRSLLRERNLQNRRVLVTAGRTEEPIDPVRFISNRSSGRMGFALAREAAYRGAEVTLIAGVHDIQPPEVKNLICIRTASEMAEAVKTQWEHHDILVMAAAVADFRPVSVSSQKIKRATMNPVLELAENEDIIATAAKIKGNRLVVGFALETGKTIERGKEKLQRKGMDMIIVNNPLEQGAGFATETNKVTIITRDGNVEDLPLASKNEVAREIWDRIVALQNSMGQRHHEKE